MTKVIVKDNGIRREACDGQIREDGDGRIIMVITDERPAKIFGERSRTIRALVLRAGKYDLSEMYTTIPREYETYAELASSYPKVLSGTITIEGSN